MRTSAGLSRVQAPPLLGSVLLFRGCWGVCECAGKVRVCETRGLGRGASCAACARFPHPAGSCSPGPGGAWEAGGGSGFLGADSAGRAQGPHTWSPGSCRARPGGTLHVEPAPLPFAAGPGARARAPGPIPERMVLKPSKFLQD